MKSFRLIIILLAILCVVFLVFGMISFSGLQSEKKTRVATENSLKDLTASREDLMKQLDEDKKLKADLEMQLADLKGKFTSLQDKAEKLAAQIADERKAKEEALAKLSGKDPFQTSQMLIFFGGLLGYIVLLLLSHYNQSSLTNIL